VLSASAYTSVLSNLTRPRIVLLINRECVGLVELSDQSVSLGLLVVGQKSILQQEPATSVALHVVGPFQQLPAAYVANNLYCRHLICASFLSLRNCLH